MRSVHADKTGVPYFNYTCLNQFLEELSKSPVKDLKQALSILTLRHLIFLFQQAYQIFFSSHVVAFPRDDFRFQTSFLFCHVFDLDIRIEERTELQDGPMNRMVFRDGPRWIKGRMGL